MIANNGTRRSNRSKQQWIPIILKIAFSDRNNVYVIWIDDATGKETYFLHVPAEFNCSNKTPISNATRFWIGFRFATT